MPNGEEFSDPGSHIESLKLLSPRIEDENENEDEDETKVRFMERAG